MGLDHDFNLRRLDRFLVLAHSADARVVVVLTKADDCADVAGALARVRTHLGDARDDIAVRRRRRPLAERGAGAVAVARARQHARDARLQRRGQDDADQHADRRVVDHATRCATTDERGQHTTTVRTLHRTGGGACLIDTPGLRQLWLDADADTLNGAFPEIGTLALQCRYRNCRHAQEPGCAVREQVPPERLVSFQKLLREANRESEDIFQRRRQVAEMKQRTRDNRARNAARAAEGR